MNPAQWLPGAFALAPKYFLIRVRRPSYPLIEPQANCGVISVTTQWPWLIHETVCASMLLSEYAQPPIEPRPSTTAAPAPGGPPFPGRESNTLEPGAGDCAAAAVLRTSAAARPTTASLASRR